MIGDRRRRTALRRVGVLAGITAWCVVASGGAPVGGQQAPASQAPPPQQPSVAFRTGIELVTVDVTVLARSGDPVTELKAEDFTVTVDGKPRPITAARLVQAAAGGATEAAPTGAPAAVDAARRRLIILVVDRDHIPAGEGQPILAAAAQFVDALPAGDQVGLWTLPYASGALRLNEGREALTGRLRASVGTYRPPQGPWVVGRDEAIRFDDNVPGVLAEIIVRECDRQPPTCPKEVENQARELARDARQRADATLIGLSNLIESLKAVRGPKHLVLVTGGPVSTIDNRSVIVALGQQASDARVTLHALQVPEPSYQARTDLMRATPAEIDQQQSAAYLLAGATGGLALTPTTGAIGFTRLTRELSASYELVFETIPGDHDGKTHAIGVAVKDRGWGSTVRARRSFRIDPATAGPAATAPAIDLAAPVPSAALVLPPEPVGTDPGDMADRLADYAEAFERVASSLVAEERYVQIIQPWRGRPGGPDKEPALRWLEAGDKPPKTGPIIARRQLVSDVLMAQVKDQQWVAYRDVAEVDGQAVRNRTDRVMQLFLSQAPDKFSQFQAIAMESSRYNLGDVKRDINLPTITLSLLRRANHWRFEFKKQKDETIDGRVCRVLAYRERESPSLISTRNSGDVFIYGRIWLDQADGRVWRTEFRFDRGTGAGGFRSYVLVDYGPVDGIDTLVPVRMWEWHEGVNQLGRIGGDLTGAQGLAAYSKIRRFGVTTTETIK